MIDTEEVDREALEAGVMTEVEFLRRQVMRLRMALTAPVILATNDNR